MQEIKAGTLLRWHGENTSDWDVDDIGLVMSAGEEQPWILEIHWTVIDHITQFVAEDIRESLEQGQMEIVG
jgi:hypothetical protein